MPAITVKRWSVTLGLIGILLGVVVSVRWQPQAPVSGPDAGVGRPSVSTSIRRLEEEQKALRAQLTGLQRELEWYQGLAASRKDSLSEIVQELEQQKVLAGLVPLRGPAIKVVLDDSTKAPAPSDDLSNYIVHEYQLRDVVNLMWEAGAEAISLNSERVVGSTSIYCVGSTILVNSTRLSPPYEITAVGNAAVMESVLNRPGTLAALRSVSRQYGIKFQVQRLREATVGAYEGPLTVKYANLNTAK